MLPMPLAAGKRCATCKSNTPPWCRPASRRCFSPPACPDDLRVMAGGYKLLASELPLRDVIMVESRPVPEQRQWAVTLLYEPPAPAALPAGELKIEVWAACAGSAHSQPGQLSQKPF
jgi:hypothetical protein